MADAIDALDALDRDAVMLRMADELPGIRKTLKIKAEDLADKTGIDADRFKDIEDGKQPMVWSEYMSILFVIWNNDIGRGILESKGLFPDALKKAMSMNRNAHPPVTESAKHGF